MRNYKYRDMVVIAGKIRERRVGMSDIFANKMIGSSEEGPKYIDYRYVFKANLSEALTALTTAQVKDKEDMEEAKNVLSAGLRHLEDYRNVSTEALFTAIDGRYERLKENNNLVSVCTKAALIFIEGLADDIDYYQDNVSDSSIRELVRETKGLIAVIDLMMKQL